MYRTFVKKPLYLGIAVAGMTLNVASAIAQESSAAIEEITVTGSYAGSLAKALDTKRDSTT
ncbi:MULTISPECIES: hypothetical protein [unclassified Microbulbifer]|uniref:hypothetical protein n=1 Tax=unclassified Microbulbifer TaxID=2619833 RepID=UPI0027E4C722|nr:MULTISPECIES: hypothetical protein [unclassified Microbulbifer]